MTAIFSTPQDTDIFYPSEDGEPLAETYDHLYAILTTLEMLKGYFKDRRATVLADQFLYYSQGFPALRVAPDVMVIFDVEPGGRDNYKIWQEQQVPSVIFEMTSSSTQEQDKVFKKTLYEQLGVKEYWLFDPKGEWIAHKLQGYRLEGEEYQLINEYRSEPLGLTLKVEGKLLAFYREDNGEKLLIPDELREALEQQRQRAELAEQQVEQERRRAELAEQRAEQLAAKLRELGIDPDL
ncbi:Uma2 family endonuclease [Gloeothece verrucosa]|uniref:Putative restriction endonuclease domain-containing protein n=1 Tax=Gloeothece verrucosa (strain PCC 7822) TaxID=497965 RepID=E0UA87_GLOV7|nr:Uma2 family endonuclease [Gloeothece verrucosa]ADN17392.1 protein of unknown function DUF820 [Gloeothece verrucosa PCC 7822]